MYRDVYTRPDDLQPAYTLISKLFFKILKKGDIIAITDPLEINIGER